MSADLTDRLNALASNVRLAHDCGSRGRGLLAARAFDPGDEIFSETSILCCSSATAMTLRRTAAIARMRRPGVRATKQKATPQSLLSEPVLLCSNFTARAVDPLSPRILSSLIRDDSDASDNLCALRLADILRENAAEASFGPASFPSILLVLSMINHSCHPNAGWHSSWDAVASQPRFSVRAARSIAEGDEILFSYVSVDVPRSTRQAQLASGWNFRCQCSRCSSVGDDAMVLRCAVCGDAVPCVDNPVGCPGCDSDWLRSVNVSSADEAAALRSDVLWWMRDEPHLTHHILSAISKVHPRDADLRKAMIDVIDAEFAIFDSENGKISLCQCRLRMLVELAGSFLDGSQAPWMRSLSLSPAAHLVAGDVYILATVATDLQTSCVRSQSSNAICSVQVFDEAESGRIRERALDCLSQALSAAKRTTRQASSNEFVQSLESALYSPPMSIIELLGFRAARRASLAADVKSAGGNVDAKSAGILFPPT